jgi:hypothetical protein
MFNQNEQIYSLDIYNYKKVKGNVQLIFFHQTKYFGLFCVT